MVKIISHQMRNNLCAYLGNHENINTFGHTLERIVVALTLLGVHYDTDLTRRNCGIYTFRVQERMYHLINDLYPGDKKPINLQLYFYDSDD